MLRITVGLALLCVAAVARAQTAPAPAEAEAEPDEEEAAPTAPPTAEDLAALQEENTALREELDLLREDLDALSGEVDTLKPLRSRISGYLDLGFFAVSGDGSGLRTDPTGGLFPEYAYAAPWIFLGDPLSVAINARGDPATTGDSRAITLDPIDTAGPTALVNALALQLYAGLGADLAVTAAVDFLPRGRDVANPDGLFLGDYLDVKLAYVEYQVPWKRLDLRLQAGKVDSVVGYEYRIQESPDRLTVTPSLICRYLCGHPIGVKARARFLDGAIIANLAATNGTHFSEGFAFADEIDRNGAPTGALRLSYAPLLPGTGAAELELGVSGAYGAQDGQPDSGTLQWHVGADAHLVWGDLELTAEYVRGKAPGVTSGAAGTPPCDEAPCLTYQGAYGLVGYRLGNTFVPYARADWRDALHRDGASFVYISRLWRATAGLRMEFGAHVILKAEYTVNRELDRIPQFADDVLASSLVVTY